MWNGGQDLNDSGEAILLLEPPVQTARINDGVSTTTKHANESFLGGHAIYYANDKHYSTQKLSPSTKCEVCNDHMYLLVQLYAPLDGLDRTLYVFACNKAGCLQHAFSTSSVGERGGRRNDMDGNHRFSLGGYGVVKCLRSQCLEICSSKDGRGNEEEAMITSIIMEKEDMHENNIMNQWDSEINNDDDFGWGDVISEKTNKKDDDVQKDNVPSMDDLEAMLSAMEANELEDIDGIGVGSLGKKKMMKKKKKNSCKKQQVPTTTSANNSMHDTNSYKFKRYDLEAYDEPPSDAMRNSTSTLIIKNDKMENDYDDDNIGITYRDDVTIQKMLSSYLKEEDDEGVKSVIQKGVMNNNISNHNISGTSRYNNNNNGEKDERLSPEDRAFLAFTDRIKRAPYQCVRYAYDGLPMWSM